MSSTTIDLHDADGKPLGLRVPCRVERIPAEEPQPLHSWDSDWRWGVTLGVSACKECGLVATKQRMRETCKRYRRTEEERPS